MNPPLDPARRDLVLAAFWMPSVQTMVSRKSTITNAFVNSIIPTVAPTAEEIDEALTILCLDPADLRCSYCGDKATEWDHLRPLVQNRRPTGFISEIGNLVPSCGKCNQSKRNDPWRTWMLSASAKLSPTGRNIPGTAERIARLEAYERWRVPSRIDFEAILGPDRWRAYWEMLENVDREMKRCQDVADQLRAEINAAVKV